MCFNRPTVTRTIEDSGDPTQGGTGFSAGQGWTHLDGDRALAFVRSRRLLAQQQDGEWVRLGVWNDLERNSRQQQFIFSGIRPGLRPGCREPTNPPTLTQYLRHRRTHLKHTERFRRRIEAGETIQRALTSIATSNDMRFSWST